MNIQILLSFFILTSLIASLITAQQNYSANSILTCKNSDENGPSPAFLYTCNGQRSSCQAFLIFKSQPPYDSVPTISILTSSNPSELARINNVTKLTVFPTNKEVIVPVNCSCSGQYYQVNTTFNITKGQQTYFIIANDTYQGLSTCDALKSENPYGEYDLMLGHQLRVPLRCACPTRNQTANGVKYLLTYSIFWGDNIPDIGDRFNASANTILYANGFPQAGSTIFPFTTILIPMSSEPSSSQLTIQNPPPVISPPVISPPVISPPSSPNLRNLRVGDSKRELYVGIGTGGGCSVLVLCVILFAFILYYNKKRTKQVPSSYGGGEEKGEGEEEEEEEEEETKGVSTADLLVEIASFDQVMKVFEFEELIKATQDFSPKSRIKGSVYRGVFSGEILAVKKMSTDVSEEVNMLNKFNHFNLIKLHGVCEKHGCFYLVFEFLENGSLREWLCNNKDSKEKQTWTWRIQIALDVANGLHYLHSFTKPAYVHKDIKSSNVLLNTDLRAKIANFSLARTAVKGTSNGAATTTRFVGTRGYMAPEYIKEASVTPKVDVYAFGVVMLELITGKDAVFVKGGGEVLLSAAVISIMEGVNVEAELGSFLDPNLKGNNGVDFAIRVAKLSVSCLTRDPESRPSMSEVVSSLLKIRADLQRSQSAVLRLKNDQRREEEKGLDSLSLGFSL